MKPSILYFGDGVSKQFDITFPYLRRSHIYAFINNSPVNFSWINNSRIELDQTPPANIIVKIERHTPQAPLHLLQNNRPQAAEQFMELALQAMYYAEEQVAHVAKGDKGDKGDMGDMNKTIYDPSLIQADMFNMDNMVEGANTKILTANERGLIASAVQPAQIPDVPPAKFHVMTFNYTSSSQTINWPSWVTPDTPVHVTAWGGGGSGSYSGGGGGECVIGWYRRSGFPASVVVGAGGVAPTIGEPYGNNGGDTKIGSSFIIAHGGCGGGQASQRPTGWSILWWYGRRRNGRLAIWR